jgi:hypothetical protein
MPHSASNAQLSLQCPVSGPFDKLGMTNWVGLGWLFEELSRRFIPLSRDRQKRPTKGRIPRYARDDGGLKVEIRTLPTICVISTRDGNVILDLWPRLKTGLAFFDESCGYCRERSDFDLGSDPGLAVEV